MGSIYRFFAISLLLVQIYQVCCGSQEVYFEIKDGNFNEVIFIGEKNITLICHVSNTSNVNVTITKVGEGSVATNGGIGNCLEYNIQQVTAQNGGNYSCTSRYEDKNTQSGRLVEMSQILSLHVRDNESASCLRNGTGLYQAYSEGDVLLLSCYCDISIECNWIKSVEGSQVGESIPPMEVLQHKGKVIRRIVVGPLTPIDIITRYDCSSGSSLDERCSIGPVEMSINDVVSLSIPQSDLSEGCPLSVTPIPGIFTEEVSSKRNMPYTDDSTEKTKGGQNFPGESDDFLLYIIIGVCILVVLVLVILFSFIILKNRRKEKEKEEEAERPRQEDVENKIPTYAVPVKKKISAEVVQYAISNAAIQLGEAEDGENEEFCSVGVTEYSIPVAFRTDELGGKF